MKKTIITANAIFEPMSTPYQRIKIGAKAIFGTALAKTRNGPNTFWSLKKYPSSIPVMNPVDPPITKPHIASWRVTHRSFQKSKSW